MRLRTYENTILLAPIVYMRLRPSSNTHCNCNMRPICKPKQDQDHVCLSLFWFTYWPHITITVGIARWSQTETESS